MDTDDWKCEVKYNLIERLNAIRSNGNGKKRTIGHFVHLLDHIESILDDIVDDKQEQLLDQQLKKKEFQMNYYFSCLNEILYNFNEFQFFVTDHDNTHAHQSEISQLSMFKMKLTRIVLTSSYNYEDTLRALSAFIVDKK
jgi:hypothetical protein